ncbi:hypothetical protein MMC16_002084 [Acarospora aff. strigata]|nr:hypothetical protein [Acarospora aff. strigata]
MRVLFLPELDYWLQDSDVVIYPYNNTFDEACHDPFVVMHSSGSTGIPKVLHWAHGTVSAHDAFQLIPSLGGNPWIGQCWAGKRVFTSFPWVHAAGLLLLLPLAVFSGVTPVITGTWPADAKLVNSAHIHGNVSASFTPASILIELVKEPLWLDNLRRLDYLTWSGGTLAQNTGDLISTKTRLFGLFGSTECGYLPAELPAPEDWPYYKYSSVLRHEFRHSGDDLYELVIIRNPDERDPFQAIFATFPDLQEYSMRDLYLPHPTKEGWWRSCGRVDDVIAFADARKLNPTRLEAAIEAHPAIAAALICGQGQLQPALLLQPETHPATEDERARLLRDIWPAVERANHVGPVPGRLSERLVLFTAQEKPMARAGAKQTIQRKSTLHLYRDEIERLYAAAGAEGATVNGLTDRTSLRLSAGESPRDNSEGRTQLGT